MSAQLQEAIIQLRHDRRFAEITASFNGINLRQRFPELDREQRAELVRVARRVLREQESPQPAAVLPPPQPTVGSAGEPRLAVATETAGREPSEPPHHDEPAWNEILQGTGRRRGLGIGGTLLLVLVVAALGTAAWFGRDRLSELLADASGPAVISEPAGSNGEAGTEQGSRPGRDIEGIIERHRDKLASENTVATGTQPGAVPADPEPTTDVTEQGARIPPTAPLEQTSRSEPSGSSVLAADEATTAPEPSVDAGPAAIEPDSPPSASVESAPPATAPGDIGLTPEPIAEPATAAADSTSGSTAAEASNPEVIGPERAQPTQELGMVAPTTPEPVTRESANTATAAPTESEPDEAALTAPTSPQPTSISGAGTPPYDGSADENLVRQIQARLQSLGFDPGPVDGKMGWQTYKAIREFQESKGMNVNGQPTPILLGALVSYSGGTAPSAGEDPAPAGSP